MGVVNATDNCWLEGVIEVIVETGGTVVGVDVNVFEYTELPMILTALSFTV